MSKAAVTALTVSAALAGAIALGNANIAAAADGKVQCFGVAKAGENDCGNKTAGHSCAGHSTVSYSGEDYKLLTKDQCMAMNGKLEKFEGINKNVKEG